MLYLATDPRFSRPPSCSDPTSHGSGGRDPRDPVWAAEGPGAGFLRLRDGRAARCLVGSIWRIESQTDRCEAALVRARGVKIPGAKQTPSGVRCGTMWHTFSFDRLLPFVSIESFKQLRGSDRLSLTTAIFGLRFLFAAVLAMYYHLLAADSNLESSCSLIPSCLLCQEQRDVLLARPGSRRVQKPNDLRPTMSPKP